MKRILFALVLLLGSISMGAQSNAKYGDVNNDGQVDQLDVNAVSDIIMGKAASTESADVNNDSKVNAGDIVSVVDAMKINQIAEDIDRACSVIVPLYAQSESIADLSQHLSTIRNVEGVEDAWIDGQALFVDIIDYGTITFLYPPQLATDEVSKARLMQLVEDEISNMNEGHKQIDVENVCIYNHMDIDERCTDARWVSNQLEEMYWKMGVKCEYTNYVLPYFFEKQIFNYDHLFIITHGWYNERDNAHWLATDEEILCLNKTDILSNKSCRKEIVKFLSKNGYQLSNKIGLCIHNEVRHGDIVTVAYVSISEHYVSSSDYRFKNPNAIVFNAACESLKGAKDEKGNKTVNESMAYAFINKGAKYYIGYDDSNTIGRLGGFEFYQALLNGSCIQSAFGLIEECFKTENLFEYKYANRDEYTYSRSKLTQEECDKLGLINVIIKEDKPEIRIIPEITNDFLCITHSETSDFEYITNENNIIKLKGQMKKCNSDALLSAFSFTDVSKIEYNYTLRSLKDKYNYGFQYSTNSDMSDATEEEADVKSYDEATLYMNWEKTLDTSNLKPNTTYYYRAYMNDGVSYCYGEIKSFTINGMAEEDTSDYYAYALFNEDTLTFYFDNKRKERSGTLLNWVWGMHWLNGYTDKITKVIFDKSFAKYLPDNTAYWFYQCTELTQIEGLQYLNTANVTDMSGMFACCNSLTSLDLSSFNTSMVNKMYMMFYKCNSLTNLDVSSFNTAKVTTMEEAFCGCSSLKSLDVSNFNTASVRSSGMRRMFGNCNSLTSIDVSNFTTDELTDIGGMFGFCSSLTNIDLSSFNTTKVTSISGLFSGCSSLTSVDVSSFNTDRVTNMSSMFYNCSSLVTLDLSNFNVAKDEEVDCREMFRKCSSLTTIYAGNWKHFVHTNIFTGCEKLVGGKGTKIGNNLYDYGVKGNPLYYFCDGDGRNAHIDGGKDNPGLFTAK